jgi:hypothetical protein
MIVVVLQRHNYIPIAIVPYKTTTRFVKNLALIFISPVWLLGYHRMRRPKESLFLSEDRLYCDLQHWADIKRFFSGYLLNN